MTRKTLSARALTLTCASFMAIWLAVMVVGMAGTAHASDYADPDGLLSYNAANSDGLIVYGIARDVSQGFERKVVRAANAWNDLRQYNKAAPRFLRKRNAPEGIKTTLRIYGHVDTTEHGAGYYTHTSGPALDYVHYDLGLIADRNEGRPGYAQRLASHELGHPRGHADNPFTTSASAADETVMLQTAHWFYYDVPFRRLPGGRIDREVNSHLAGYYGYN